MLQTIWAACHGLLARRFVSSVTLSTLVTTGLAFALLAGSVQRSQAIVAGDVRETWHTPFDILVRPTGSRSNLESQGNLIRSNYLDALAGGGINSQQLDAIKRLPGVAIAAPISVIGIENWQVEGFDVTQSLPPPNVIQVYRATFTETAEAGLSAYPVETHYLILSGSGEVHIDPTTLAQRLSTDQMEITCTFPISCFAPLECFGQSCERETQARYGLEVLQPILVAAVDPAAESRLLGLQGCLTAGRYFSSTDQPQAKDGDPPGTSVPALISDRSFVDEVMHAKVDLAADSSTVVTGKNPLALTEWHTTNQAEASIADLYRRYLPRVGAEVDDWPLWTSSDVVFTSVGPTTLQPHAVAPRPEVYDRSTFTLVGYPKDWLVPPAAKDIWFRSITAHLPVSEAANRYWNPIGQYSPQCLPGFASLAGGFGLDGYAAPSVRTEDGRALLPTRSLGGYVNSPPLVLTNLASAKWFSSPSVFTNMPGADFISAIRVKTDVGGEATTSAQDRLASIAESIRLTTGLAVDLVKGASARPISIDLPAGNGGRPALTATELWSVKGAAVRVQRLIDADFLSLILLSITAAGLAVGEISYASLRRRKHEFAILRALGWPTRSMFNVVAAEIAILSLAAAAIAVLGTFVVNEVFGLRLAIGSFVLVPPLLIAVAFVAGLIPVIASGRGPLSRGLQPDAHVARRGIRHTWWVGCRDLLATARIETIVMIATVGMGSAVLGVAMLSIHSTSQGLGASLLDLSTQKHLRDLQVGLAVILALLALFGASAVSTTNFLNRLPQYAALRAMGWPRQSIAVALLVEANLVAGLAAVTGAVIVIGVEFSRVNGSALELAVAGVVAVASLSTVPMSILPILLLSRRPIARLLGGD
jgi:putative ABC transport system permease protein